MQPDPNAPFKKSCDVFGDGQIRAVLTPGHWSKNAGKSDSKTALDPAEVARIGFEGMQRGELVIVPTAIFKAEKTVIGLLPPKARVNIIEKWQRGLIRK